VPTTFLVALCRMYCPICQRLALIHPQPKNFSFSNNNSQSEVVDLLDENEESKENFLLMDKTPSKKKKPVIMAGNDASSLLYDAISKPDPSFDRLANMMAEFQKGQVEAETHHEREKMEAEERRVMLEERSPHMRLLEMLHVGTISLEMYNTMKPKGF
jgi:hypothetical protein